MDAATSSCSQLLGFKSSKIPIYEPRLPSELSFTHQPSWPKSFVLKAVNQAVFISYALVHVVRYHNKDTPVFLALAFAVAKDHVVHSGISVVTAVLKDHRVRDEPHSSSSGESI